MFTLWYSVLSWKEYREAILGKLSQKLPPSSPPESKPTPPPPPAKAEPPKVEPPRPPQVAPKPAPPQTPTKPVPQAAEPPQTPKLDPPAKPPRSPSPHPLRSEAFDDIEYEEEEEEEEEESEEEGAAKPVTVQKVTPPKVKDFINVEINQQRREFGPQRYNEKVTKKTE